jgi:putative membrane fusion protein
VNFKLDKLNKTQIKYIVYSLVGIFIIGYFIHQVVQMNSSPYKTEIALNRDMQSIIKTEAFIVRDETYITTDNSGGTVVSIAEDGKRVSSGDNVAVVFPSSESAATYVRMKELEKEIEYYSQLKNRVGIGTNTPASYSKLIDEACIEFITTSRETIGSDFDESLTDLRDAITARQLAVGTELSVDAKLAELQAELITLSSGNAEYKTIASPNSGYYIGSVDGYEKTVDYNKVDSLTCKEIETLINSKRQDTPANVMGKLVDEFDWYFVCTVPYSESGSIEVGKSVKVNVPNTAVGTINCTVMHKGDREDDKVSVVIKCNLMNRNLANLRIHDIEIIVDDYVGIKISNDAIREVDGEKGVYVQRGNLIQFRKINIIYSAEDYSVVESVADSAYLQQYDSVITQGVDLYDGKVVS